MEALSDTYDDVYDAELACELTARNSEHRLIGRQNCW